MRLWLDPVRLAARSSPPATWSTRCASRTCRWPPAASATRPAREGQTYQISVRAAGRLRDQREFDDIIVKSAEDGALVRLKDVGAAELGAETYSSVLRFQGRSTPSASASSRCRTPTRSTSSAACVAELERLSRPASRRACSTASRSTRPTVVQESISEVLKTLAEAIVLVVLVMFLFLQSWRATLIPALTMPVSLIGTFAFVKLLGFSINTLTLFAIVLATGIVVDDAIVVIENIERHIQEYRKRRGRRPRTR